MNEDTFDEIQITTPDNDSSDEIEDIVDVDDEGNEKSLQQKNKELRKKIQSLEKQKSEYLDGWQRAQADSINKQKDFEQKQKDFTSFANQRLLLDLIPVMDSFLMAMSNKTAWQAVDQNWRIGVEYIKSQLETVFTNNDLIVFGTVGDMADPYKYSSIETVQTENEAQDGTVAEILQYGYSLKGKIIREAKCKTFVYIIKSK